MPKMSEPQDKIDEFASLLIRRVRGGAIASCDRRLSLGQGGARPDNGVRTPSMAVAGQSR